LNQSSDRQVTPSLRPGEEMGTVDIDLTIKDKLPLHGSIELNDRSSPNTSDLRVNGALSYRNLWQLGHSLGGSFQLAPERFKDANVYSAFYTARFPSLDWLSVMVQGTKQNSNVSTLGAADVIGRGQILGIRAIATLPLGQEFFHSFNFGLDYKHFDQNITIGKTTITAPVTYYPVTANYNATWTGKSALSELNIGTTLHIRGMGSNDSELDNSRFNSDSSFIYLRADLSHSQDLPMGFQAFGKVQGQIADKPLLSAEEFGGGGLSTVRGYLESEIVGDNAIAGTLEFRTPSMVPFLDAKTNEWRFYAFGDAGMFTINSPLPEQTARFYLASFGVGSRVRLADHFNGSLDCGFPLVSQSPSLAWHPRLTFRVWADF
jgi:hemolysin activation/secretion protein